MQEMPWSVWSTDQTSFNSHPPKHLVYLAQIEETTRTEFNRNAIGSSSVYFVVFYASEKTLADRGYFPRDGGW